MHQLDSVSPRASQTDSYCCLCARQALHKVSSTGETVHSWHPVSMQPHGDDRPQPCSSMQLKQARCRPGRQCYPSTWCCWPIAQRDVAEFLDEGDSTSQPCVSQQLHS